MEELEGLCKALKEGGWKSKQAVFTYYYDDFCRAKARCGWESVVQYINDETGDNLTINTYKTMIRRVSKKSEASIKKSVIEKKELGLGLAKNQGASTQKKALPLDGIDQNSYLQACFNNKIIAQEAIDNEVSIETIKSWGCANFVQLSTALGNHIRSKRK